MGPVRRPGASHPASGPGRTASIAVSQWPAWGGEGGEGSRVAMFLARRAAGANLRGASRGPVSSGLPHRRIGRKCGTTVCGG